MHYRLYSITLFTLLFFSCRESEGPPIDEVIAPLSTINIQFEGEIPIDDKVSATFIIDEEDELVVDGKIERRGGFSIGFPKHSYEIDLTEDIPIDGMPEDDDWILNANYIDKTFIRHKLSYDLFRSFNDENLSPRSRFTELSLNDVYNGLYLIMEKLDKSSLQINSKDTSAFIFKEPPVFIADDITPQDPDNFYQQVYPKIENLDKTWFAESFRAFLFDSDDALFNEQVADWIDINNIIDWHVLILLSNNNDGILKNFYLYKKETTSLLKVAPWDYDHAYGRDGDNELNLIDRYANPERSILFERLLKLDSYKQELKLRWSELRSTIITPESLNKQLDELVKQIAPYINDNTALWPNDGPWYYDDNDFNMEILLIKEYFEIRIPELDTYFESI